MSEKKNTGKKAVIAVIVIALIVVIIALAVAIDGAANAALLAAEMIAIEDEELYKRLVKKRSDDTAKVLSKNAAVEEKYNS